MPRIIRSKARQIDQAHDALNVELGRAPRYEEMAERLGMTLQEYYDAQSEVPEVSVVSLSPCEEEHSHRASMSVADLTEDRRCRPPDEEMRRQDMAELIMKGLNRKEKRILLLYYYEDITFREVGEVLGLSESRVCQLHTRCISRLANLWKNRSSELLAEACTF